MASASAGQRDDQVLILGASVSGLTVAVAADGGFAFRRLADLERIDADRLGNVLEALRAEIADREIESRFHLPVGLF